MIGVDTNVIVRLLVRDDAEQFRRAEILFRREDVFLSATVLLETEWVLRFTYGFSAERIAEAIRALVALPNAEVENREQVEAALAWHVGGLDFADALLLAKCGSMDGVATFDERFARRAKALGEDGVQLLR